MAISPIQDTKQGTNTLLCIDTSSPWCSVGIVSYRPSKYPYTADDITIMAETTMPMQRGHAEHIMPAIVNVLKLTHTDVVDLSGVAATVGPGAFTGIRIALSTAKGLCLPHKIPCIGVCNAHAIAIGAIGGAITESTEPMGSHTCTVILESKRTDYYVSTYEKGSITKHQSLCFEDAVKSIAPNTPITGDGVNRFMAQWQDEMPHTPQPSVLPYTPPLSITHMAISALNAPLPPVPIYVRPPDVQPPKSGLVPQNSLKPKRAKKNANGGK